MHLRFLPEADPTGVEYASSISCIPLDRASNTIPSLRTSPSHRRLGPLPSRRSLPVVHAASRPHNTRRSDARHVTVKAYTRLPLPMAFRTKRSDSSCRCRRRPHHAYVAGSRRMARGHHEEQLPSWRNRQRPPPRCYFGYRRRSDNSPDLQGLGFSRPGTCSGMLLSARLFRERYPPMSADPVRGLWCPVMPFTAMLAC